MPSFVWNLFSKWPIPFVKRRFRQISAYDVSTVRDNEKSSITTNRKSITSFPTSYRWSAYVTPKSLKAVLELRGPGRARRPLRCREKLGLQRDGFSPPSLVRMSWVFCAYFCPNQIQWLRNYWNCKFQCTPLQSRYYIFGGQNVSYNMLQTGTATFWRA